MDVLSPEQMVSLSGVFVTVGVGLIVTVFVATAAEQPPAGTIESLTVYVPGVLAVRSISPVLVFTKTSPAGVALKVPALAPTPNVGMGLMPF
jgi:hypothetical protein